MKVKTTFSNNIKCYLVTTDNGITITDACKYLKSLSLSNISNSTVSANAYNLALYFEYLEIFRLNYMHMTDNEINNFIYYLNSNKLRTFKRINNIIDTINNFYQFLLQSKNGESYIDKVKKFNINNIDKCITKDEEIHVIDDIEPICKLTTNLRDELLVRILFETGAKGSEVINLTIDDLIYHDSYCLKGFKYGLCPQKTCSECSYKYYGYMIKLHSYRSNYKTSRLVPISENLSSLIIDYYENIVMNIKPENKFIFIHLNGTNIGKQLSYSYIHACLKSLCKKSDFNISTISLRCSFVLNALSKYDLQYVSYISGLSSPLSICTYLSKLKIHNSSFPNASLYKFI